MSNWIDTMEGASSVNRSVSQTKVFGTGFIGSLAKLSVRAVDMLLNWQQRAVERQHLYALSDHILKDVGLSRADVAHESAKPFWRE